MTEKRRTAKATGRPADNRIVVDLKSNKQLLAETNVLQTRAAAIVVDSIESSKAAKLFLAGVTDLRRKIESHYEQIKRPLNDARNEILAMEKRDLDPVRTVERHINGRIADFEAAEERRRREAARAEEDRLRREEELRREREAEVLRQQAAATANRTDKRALVEQAKAIETAPPPTPTVRTVTVKEDAKVDGMVPTTTWSGDVENFEAFVKLVAAGRAPLEALAIDRGWLQKQAVALQARLSEVYPGLVAKSKTTYVNRG